MKASSIYALRPGVPEEDPNTTLGCDQEFNINYNRKLSVLITGTGSYIGESFKAYAEEHYPENFIVIDSLDMTDQGWRSYPFTTRDENGVAKGYDSVFHVAGIAHADISNATLEEQKRYYDVNTDLAIEACRKSKENGVLQFIFMSSMIIYGDMSFNDGRIDRNTKPHPINFYGDSKWQADKGVRALQEKGRFEIAVLRPPMIYGKGSKGNYRVLSKLAKKLPLFPAYRNQRSMLYIENLCEFLCELMISGKGGIFFPQNAEYSNTSDMVGAIGRATNKPIKISKFLTPMVNAAMNMPLKRIKRLAEKAFGNSYYVQDLSSYRDINYQLVSLEESIRRTEG